MIDDDDVPGPDAEPTAQERSDAKRFSALVDKSLVGKLPVAMDTEDRELLDVATVIRAGTTQVELPAAKITAMVEAALAKSVGATPSDVIAITRARRWLPWSITGATSAIAAAAIALLVVRAPHAPKKLHRATDDALVGEIKRADSGNAAARLDYIFADRLDAYRERRFGGAK